MVKEELEIHYHSNTTLVSFSFVSSLNICYPLGPIKFKFMHIDDKVLPNKDDSYQKDTNSKPMIKDKEMHYHSNTILVRTFSKIHYIKDKEIHC